MIHTSVQIAQPSRLAVAATCMMIFAALSDAQIVAAIAPQIASALNAPKTVIASSVTIYSISAALVALALGRYAHHIHAGLWLTAAAILFALAGLVASASTHPSIFFAARSLAGVAGGLISALAIASLANVSSYAQRGKQMSAVAVSYYLAPIIGVPIGTFLSGQYGWRAVFYLSALLSLVSGILVHLFPLAGKEKLAWEKPREKSDIEKRFRLSLWEIATRSRSTRMGIIGAIFVSGGLVGWSAYLGTWLSDAFSAGTSSIGLVYAIAGLCALAGGFLGGILADRLGKRRVAVLSSGGMAISLLLVPLFGWGETLVAVIGATSLMGALRVAPLQALITERVMPRERAVYVALRNSASQLGIAGAVAAAGLLYTQYRQMGVGILCSLLTIGACLSIAQLDDPHHHKR